MVEQQRFVRDDNGGGDRLLPWPIVKHLTGLSRTTAWRLQRTGVFPQPVEVSPGRVCWREQELKGWTLSRVPRTQKQERVKISKPEPPSVGNRSQHLEPATEPPILDSPPPHASIVSTAPLTAQSRARKRRAVPKCPGQLDMGF